VCVPVLFCACVKSLETFVAVDAGAQPTLGVTAIAASNANSCAIWHGGLFCWGDNTYGQLGTGDQASRDLPVRVGQDSDWAQVQAGYQSTCALKADGSVWCWGGNGEGQLGLGLPDAGLQLTPAQVSLGFAAQAIALHFEHVCVLTSDGSLWCWGFNFEGQLGLNDNYPGQNKPLPVAVAVGTHWRAVDTGQGHTCGIQTDGSLWCWGRNSVGQLAQGTGAPIQIRVPTRVGTGMDWSLVRATQNASCALAQDGTLWWWGDVYDAPIGQHELDVATPVDAGTWVDVSVEPFDICGLKADATLWCWGRNNEGELGTGDQVDRYTPVLGVGTFQASVVGRFHRCALDARGGIYCTGQNTSGQLGVGDTVQRSLLTPVSLESSGL
jgi:alpha-tubulin suppressor-like RCC1 family protein